MWEDGLTVAAPQVHEKSILLPLLPVTMLAGREPYLAAALPLVASFSMFPLLKKDGLAVAYAGANLLWTCLAAPKLFPADRWHTRFRCPQHFFGTDDLGT